MSPYVAASDGQEAGQSEPHAQWSSCELGPYLNETDCELVEMTVFTATAIGLFVLFDVRE
ncbi:hypothetical protein NKH37_33575 [Mesorhizobium sp. M1217]